MLSDTFTYIADETNALVLNTVMWAGVAAFIFRVSSRSGCSLQFAIYCLQLPHPNPLTEIERVGVVDSGLQPFCPFFGWRIVYQ